MCHFSRIDRTCGHFEDQEITFGNQCKTVCEESKTNTKAMARAGNCSRCRKRERPMQRPSKQLNGHGVSGVANKLGDLQVSAQPAPHGEKPAPTPAAPKEKPAPKPAAPKEKLASKPAAPGQKTSDPRPGQRPANLSSTSGRAGQGAAGTPSAAVKVSVGTSQTRPGNRGIPAVN